MLGDLWPPLNANGAADAVYWTEDEMYKWFDEGAKRLAADCGVFVRYDVTLAAATGTAAYSLPADHVSTLQADLDGTALNPRNVQQLEALDAAWPTAAGTPNAFVQDTRGVAQLTLYPKPQLADNGKAIGITEHGKPADITVTSAILAAPVPIKEYFRFYALGEARAKETKAQMQETAQWFKGLAGMLEKTMIGYYGTAQ